MRLISEQELEYLSEIKNEAFNAIDSIESYVPKDKFIEFPEINDALYKSTQSLKHLMGVIDKSVKHNVEK